MKYAPHPKFRFDRVGNVVQDRRLPGPLVGTDDYRDGDRLFAVRPGSPARQRFQAANYAKLAAKHALRAAA